MKARLFKIFSGILLAVYLSSMALTGAVFATPKLIGSEQFPATKHEPKRGVNPETGQVSFIGGGDPVKVAGVSGIKNLSPHERGLGMANAYGKEFGLKNPAHELKLVKAEKNTNGNDIVRYQQMHQGIPILSGEMIVNMNTDGDLLSISGEISSNLTLDTKPVIKAQEARKTALHEIAELYEVDEQALTASDPELWIFDESLLTASTRPVELVWRMEVTPKDSLQPIREMVLVSAQTGTMSWHVNQVDTDARSQDQGEAFESEIEAPSVNSTKSQQTVTTWPVYFDIELDETRGWIYGSDSTGSKIDVISISTLQLVKSFSLASGANPKGIALSPDGNELAVAQNGASSLLFLHPDTGAIIASVAPNTGSVIKPWDVVYGREGRLYSSGNPGASSFDYIHIIDTITHTEIGRSSSVMRDAPILAISSDKNWLYATQIGSPTILYKFDVSADIIPSPSSTEHSSGFTGTTYILDNTDNLIFTDTGQVWTANLKAKVGSTGVAGKLFYIPTRDAIAIATSNNAIVFASTKNFYPLSRYELPVQATIGPLVAQADGSRLFASTSNGIITVDLSAFPPGIPSTLPNGTLPYFDLVLDEVHDVLYGSNTTGQRIDIISTSTLQVIDQIHFNNGSNPLGMDLNPVTNQLAVALSGASQIAFINTNTNEITATVIPVVSLYENSPFDVKYGRTGRLYSTGKGQGSDYLHVIDTATYTDIGHSLPPQTIISGSSLAISADQNFVYAAGPVQLHKFNVSTDNPVWVKSTPFNAEFGTPATYLLDTKRELIFTDTGQVWTSALTGKVGSTGVAGKLTLIPNRNALAIATSNNILVFASADNFYPLSTYEFTIPGKIGPLVAQEDGNKLYASTNNGITDVDLSSFPPGEPVTLPGGSFPYFDLVLDEAHGVLYGSNTTGNKIDIISISTLKVIDQVRFNNGSAPKGLDLNSATNQLAVALSGAAQVAFINTNTHEIMGTVIPVVDDDNSPFDVKYGRSKRLYSTGSAATDYLHVIDTERYVEIGRSVYPNDISFDSYLAISADKNFIYANESQFLSTDTLYKFNVSTDNPVLQTKTGFSSNYAADNFLLLRDNTKVFTNLGQVWSSDLATRLGAFSTPGNLLEIPSLDLVAVMSTSSPGLITFIRSTNYSSVSTLSIPGIKAVGASAVTFDGETLFFNTNVGIKALNISVTSPTSISANAGSAQSVQVSTPFQDPLKIRVLNILGDPMPGIAVTFQAPVNGASGAFVDTNSNTTSAVTDVNGIATSALLMANDVAGTYSILASITSLEASVAFQLTNLASINCTIVDGSGSITLFQPYKQFGCGKSTDAVVTGDFNTDGREDAAASASDGTLLVFLQDQEGNFDQPRSYAASVSHQLVVGDFNHDGRDDIAMSSGSAISVFLQKSDGIFAYPVIYATGSNAGALAAGDVNNDGLVDISVNIGGNLLGIFTQKQDGSLNPVITYPSLASAEIEIGDVNSDGLNDIVSVNIQSTNQLQIFVQKNDQTLAAYSSMRLTGCSSCIASGVAIGDVTGDQHADIVMTYGFDRPSSNIAIFAQDSNGNLLPSIAYLSYDSPRPVEVADVNSDDLPDVVTLHSGRGTSGVYLQLSNGTLAPESLYQVPYKSGYSVMDLDIDDVNSDGFPDVLIADGHGLVILYRSPKILPTATAVPSITPGPSPTPRPSSTPSPTVTLGPSATPLPPSETGYRETYTLSGETILPGILLCNQSKTVCTNGVNLDADHAHQFAADTFIFYKTHHGRNSLDNLGGTIISSVDYGIGYQNAFWNGSQMVYGDNMAADDVVGHELTHAVTRYSSDLLYSYQSGAINESFSDIWGEFIDQTNGSGNDLSNVSWLLGEDSALGPIRSMKNPPTYNDPDKMSSVYYYGGSGDNGGVHINSGISNKAAYLMVTGDTFNGKVITGIGLNKTAAIYYEVQTKLLTFGANYSDLYYALNQACQNLIGGADGITQSDCDQVNAAAEAVEMMNTLPPAPTPTPIPTLNTLWFNSNQNTRAEFGASVNSAGDVNGDGLDDVLIGSPGYWEGQSAEGAAFLYFGSATGPVNSPTWAIQSNHVAWGMGRVVDTAGDVNNDGFDDILVSVPGYSNGEVGEGAVFAYYGSANGPSTAPNWIAEPNMASMYFGTSVSTAGDVNHDGYDDVIIGARYCDNGQTDEGCVYLYLGSANGLKSTPAWVKDGDQASAGFGYNVAGVGDVNGDHYDDVLIGSYNYIYNQVKGGKVYIFLGGANGLKSTASWIPESGSGMDGYGYSSSGAGDVNGDGYDDILVGAVGDDIYDTVEGKAYLYLGSSAGPSLQPDWTAQDGDVTTGFGASVSTIGDFNQDGYDDIVVGDPIYYFPQYHSIGGAVFMYFGSASGPSAYPNFSYSGGLNNSSFGSAVGSAGDVNGDGNADFLVGAPNWSSPGRAVLIFGAGINPSPTKTATPTSANVPTVTPTQTSTPTFTPTYTATFTPTATATVTSTFTATNTQTATFTPSPTNTPTSTPTKTSIGIGIYDDTDPAWSYSGSWVNAAESGPYNNTDHYTNVQNASASITFSGTQFTLYFTKYPNRSNLEVWIDGSLQYIVSENGSSLAWQQTWTLPKPLSNGIHTVQFKNPNASTLTYIDVDAIAISGPVGPGIYDDTHPAWTYAGSWGRYTGSGPYNNTLTYSASVGSAAGITIHGRKFLLSYTGDNNRGNLDVYVDGIKVGTINEYNPTPQFQKKWSSPVLSAGIHDVSFVHAGGRTYLDIDAIEVREPDLIAPGAISDLSVVTGTANGSVDLSWTAVGDDGNTGTASSYIVRYSTSPINGTNWDAATVFSNSLVPQTAGSSETLTVNGLTAGVTYYFAVRAQDEDVNTGGVSNSPFAVAKTPAPVGAGLYDDTNSAWTYLGNWTTYSGSGPYNNTLHYTNTTGNYAELVFTGTKFTLFYTKDSNRGSIDVYVDGNKVTTINAYSAFYAFQQTYISPTYPDSNHTVRLVDAGSGPYIDIDAIQIVGAPVAVPAGTYDDANSNWVYSGNWTTYSGSGPYNNTLHYTGTVGNYAELVFHGTKFTLYFTKDSNRGLIDVYVDDSKVTTLDTYSASYAFQQTYTSPAYTSGTHTVRFIHAGGKPYIDIDAIQIFGTPVAVTAGTYDDTNSNWVYSGSWATYTGSGPYNNTLHYTNTVANYAELLFNGTRFILTFTKDSNRGSIDVYVDGNKVTTINAYSASYAFQQGYTSPLYIAGNHTVRFVHAGSGSYIDLDAIQILP